MLFSIGLTTYNRNDKLKLCIESLLRQTFHDFEILVGNDYVEKAVELSSLGIKDDRVKIFNYKENLGELGNMNQLLSLASGDYFTILSDDDLFATDALQIIANSVITNNRPNVVVFPLMKIYGNSNNDSPVGLYSSKMIPSYDFFKLMLQNKLLIMGESCFYRTNYLRANGGFVQISKCKIAFYAEYFLIARAILEDKLLFIDAPLLRYRDHEGSWSASGQGKDLEIYRDAGENLISKVAQTIGGKIGRKQEGKIIAWVTDIHLKNLTATSYRLGLKSLLKTLFYIISPSSMSKIIGPYFPYVLSVRAKLLLCRITPYLLLSLIKTISPRMATQIFDWMKGPKVSQ